MLKPFWLVFALGLSTPLRADTPQQILDALVQEARATHAGFSASATRGEQFYRARQGGGDAASCSTCHTDDPRAQGRHYKTHKAIGPLAPSADKTRFSDPAKVEKWFRRNCKEVLGRTCTAAERADFTAFMISVK